MSLLETLDAYPGRGVLVRSGDLGVIEWAYFVTGRSEASRHRRVRQLDDVALVEPTRTTPADRLLHYVCAQPFADGLIVGNGDHVDLIARQMDLGVALQAVLEDTDPEPDPPINTPRIGAVITNSSAAIFSVAYRQGAIERKVTGLPAGEEVLMVQTTYAGPIDAPVGSAPLNLISSGRQPFDRLVDELWSSLRADLRVLLLAGAGASVAGSRTIHQDP